MTISADAARIQPCLWFDDQLEEAAQFYTAIFPNSSVGPMLRTNTESYGSPEVGKVLSGEFTLDGVTFRGINGGPQFRFSEAISFVVTCADQAEVDHYWDALVDGGEESRCGWLKDRFGLSWQIVPQRLYDLATEPTPGVAEAVTKAMLQMRRLVIADLESAATAATRATG